MKKSESLAFPEKGMLRKLLFKMKLTILILFAGLMQVSASVYSQANKFSFGKEIISHPQRLIPKYCAICSANSGLDVPAYSLISP